MSQTSQLLHQDHRANLELLGRTEQLMVRVAARDAAANADLVKLVGMLGRHLEQDVGRHFEFEERELFSRLREAGEGDIAGLLADEHDAIREVAAEMLPLARAAAEGRLDVDGWEALKRGTLEMVERQVAHIQKEEMALLPMLDDLLDDDTDRELALSYSA